HTHLAVTRECLVRPLHLFMEKPVATSVADADAILTLAREHRVMHAAGYVYAHLPIVEEARRLLAEGGLGALLRFSAHAYSRDGAGPELHGPCLNQRGVRAEVGLVLPARAVRRGRGREHGIARVVHPRVDV